MPTDEVLHVAVNLIKVCRLEERRGEITNMDCDLLRRHSTPTGFGKDGDDMPIVSVCFHSLC